MSPEVIKGCGYGFECDMWALGVMLYELVCGRLPFGHGATEEGGVLTEILDKPLSFPVKYGDAAGKRLLQGLLGKDQERRLGVVGGTGWQDIKNSKFFSVSVQGNLFSQIRGRELVPPMVPAGECYSHEDDLADITLSDEENLGEREPDDIGSRVLASFRKFDLNGDGLVDRSELGTVLGGFNEKLFTPLVVDEVLKKADTNCDGYIAFHEFVAWIFGENKDELLLAFREAAELEIH